MDLASVSRQLDVMLSGNFVNRFNKDGRAYRVIPMVDEDQRVNPDAILDLQIRTPSGALVAIRSIAKLETEVAPRVLVKFQQKNAFRNLWRGYPRHNKRAGAQCPRTSRG